KGGGPQSKAGEAKARLNVDVDEHHVARGAFHAGFEGVELNASGVDFGGRGEIDGKIFAELDKKSASVRNVTATVKDVKLRAGGQEVSNWWTTLDMPFLGVRAPGTIDGRLSLRAKNAEP